MPKQQGRPLGADPYGTEVPDDRLALQGRRALVVGGSGGLGAAAAKALAIRGASLVVHGGSSAGRLEATLASLRKIQAGLPPTPVPPSAEGFLLSVQRPSDLVERLAGLGRIDILVVALGPFVRKSLAQTTTLDWERMALLDLALPGALASALLPPMAAVGWGRMLFFGGTRTDGIRAYASNAAYAAAKTGLGVLVKSLAAEGAASGVACLAICPGLADTEYLTPGMRDELAFKAPGGRLLAPDEVVDPAIRLLSATPCAASGALLSMDAGLFFQ